MAGMPGKSNGVSYLLSEAVYSTNIGVVRAAVLGALEVIAGVQ